MHGHSAKRLSELMRFYRYRGEEDGGALGEEDRKLRNSFSRKNWRNLLDMMTDMLFLGPIDVSARTFAKASDQPVYYYNYRWTCKSVFMFRQL